LQLITLCYKTHTHTHCRTSWTRDRPIAESFTCVKHNIHNRQTSMPPAEFKPAIPTSELSRKHALDSAANGIGGVSNSMRHLESVFDGRTIVMPPCSQYMKP